MGVGADEGVTFFFFDIIMPAIFCGDGDGEEEGLDLIELVSMEMGRLLSLTAGGSVLTPKREKMAMMSTGRIHVTKSATLMDGDLRSSTFVD